MPNDRTVEGLGSDIDKGEFLKQHASAMLSAIVGPGRSQYYNRVYQESHHECFIELRAFFVHRALSKALGRNGHLPIGKYKVTTQYRYRRRPCKSAMCVCGA